MINRIKEAPWFTAYIVFQIAVFIAVILVPGPIFVGILIGIAIAVFYDTLQTKTLNERHRQKESNV